MKYRLTYLIPTAIRILLFIVWGAPIILDNWFQDLCVAILYFCEPIYYAVLGCYSTKTNLASALVQFLYGLLMIFLNGLIGYIASTPNIMFSIINPLATVVNYINERFVNPKVIALDSLLLVCNVVTFVICWIIVYYIKRHNKTGDGSMS